MMSVTVPTSAIQRGSPGAYVYVINADNTVSVRQIKTSAVDGDMTAVTSGLAAGERVVIDGTDRLRDGLHVIVAAEAGQSELRQPARRPKAAATARHSGRRQNAPPSGSQ